MPLPRNDNFDRSCREPTSSVARDHIPMREETWQHFPFSVLLPRVLRTGEGAPYGGQRGPDHPTPIRQSGTAWLTSKVQAQGKAWNQQKCSRKTAGYGAVSWALLGTPIDRCFREEKSRSKHISAGGRTHVCGYRWAGEPTSPDD